MSIGSCGRPEFPNAFPCRHTGERIGTMGTGGPCEDACPSAGKGVKHVGKKGPGAFFPIGAESAIDCGQWISQPLHIAGPTVASCGASAPSRC